MPRLTQTLPGAQPVDARGNVLGPPVTLMTGVDFVITIAKLKRSDDSFDEFWAEIRIADCFYRVPLRLLNLAKAA